MNDKQYFDEVTGADAPDGKLWNKCQRRLREIHGAISKQWADIDSDRITNHLSLFNPEYIEARKKMVQMLARQVNNATLPDRGKKA